MTGVPEWVERNPRWPLAPLCDCGAGPWLTGAPCRQAAAQGCAGADVEGCPRWRETAVRCGWRAPE